MEFMLQKHRVLLCLFLHPLFRRTFASLDRCVPGALEGENGSTDWQVCCCPSYAWPSKFYAVSVALMFASDMPDLKADSWRGWFKANAEDSQVSSGSQNQQPHFAVANLMPSKSPSCSWQAGRLPLRHVGGRRWVCTSPYHCSCYFPRG